MNPGCPSKVEIVNADGTVSGVMRCKSDGGHGEYHRSEISMEHCVRKSVFWSDRGGRIEFTNPHGAKVALELRIKQ